MPPVDPPPPGVADVGEVPAGLPGVPRRQAVASIHGTVYQAWWSIDAWLQLERANEVIYLEGAEDFDVVRSDSAITVQVKRHIGSISLGNAKAHEALENFWKLSNSDARRISFHYLTTSSIALEQDANFDGLSGIEAWRAARTNPELATRVGRYLETKLDAGSALRVFLASATPQLIQEGLIHPFHWITDQPDIEVVKRSVDDRITVLLDRQRRSISLCPNVRKYLESRFWEVLLEPSAASRYLTRSELLRQVETATTTYLPLAVDQLPELIGSAHPGSGLLNLLLEKVPRPPDPLLRRPALTQSLGNLVKQRKVVLLTGTVHKGKTTTAQLVASTLCPEAWWVNLTDRRPDQVDTILLALAGRVEGADCPSLVILDDVDIGQATHRVYRDSLALLIHRASAAGRGVILTAQGDSSSAAVVQDFKSVEILDVPELNSDETETLCVEHGCSKELAAIWAPFVTAGTKGHPKLIQVRLAELKARGWPRPSASDLMTQSSAVTSARQIARQLLSESVPAAVAELVYLVSECSIPVHRSVAVRLAESVPSLLNAGDIVDNLTGKWLERIGPDSLRTTALLHGVAADAWSEEKRKLAHVRIHDAILAKSTLDPAEAAALLFHAYVGADQRRLALTGMRLQVIEEKEARRAVQRQLLWLPFVALEAGKSIADDPVAAAVLRQLQFRVASTLETDGLPQICERWEEDIQRIAQPEIKAAMRQMMWLSVGFAESAKVPLVPRLKAVDVIPTLPAEVVEGGRRFFDNATEVGGIPADGTPVQAILLCAIRCVRDAVSLDDLVKWLDNKATETVRQEFEAMFEWPLVQSLGAFVQSAWSAKHEESQDWEAWLPVLTRVEEYAKRRTSSRFGREAAKAKATILTEYLARSEEALVVLDDAERFFGPSAVLLEQRANVRFQVQDDERVLEIWGQLTSGDPANKIALDPFAYRRAGISAARLKRWQEATQIFRAAAESIRPGEFERIRFGLSVDAALVASLGGNQKEAATILGEAVLRLPANIADKNEGWDAAQRAAVEVCRCIENRLWKPIEATPRIEPGYASAPGLRLARVEPGQAARSEMARAQVLNLAATLGIDLPKIADEIEVERRSRYVYVRWLSATSRLALAYDAGAGTGFIEALSGFDAAMVELSMRRQEQVPPTAPDDGPMANLSTMPERWFGLLAAGVICMGDGLEARLRIWLEESNRLLGEGAALSGIIRNFIDGATRPGEDLQRTVAGVGNPFGVRSGSAAKLLQHPPSVIGTLRLQAWLVSAAVSDGSFTRQDTWNRHVAKQFASTWSAYAQNPFQFYSPRTSVPALLSAIDALEHGSGTLKSLLISAADAVRQPLGEFIERVW